MQFASLPLTDGVTSRKTDGGVLAVSELGFGCAALMGRAGRVESLRALGAAVEQGINFFDTARSYGYGEGEALLGEFLAEGGRRQRTVVGTKFGILPTGRGGWRQRVKPAARVVVRLFPGLRRVAQRQAGTQFVAGQFSVDVLRESLAASLRALRTEYVDLLLLHAAPIEVLAQTDLLEAMGRLVEEGKVRVAGISGELDAVGEALRRHTAGELAMLRSAQFAMDPARLGFAMETRAAAQAGMLLVANHPFGGPAGVAATRAAVERLRSAGGLDADLREKLAGDVDELLPEIVLNAILRGTGVKAAVPAMVRVEHLRANVRAVERCRFSDAELEVLRGALLAEATAASDRHRS